jgi:hypothetical protein
MLNRLKCLLFGHPALREGETALLRTRKRMGDAITMSESTMQITLGKSKVYRMVDVFRCKRCHGLYWTEWEDEG